MQLLINLRWTVQARRRPPIATSIESSSRSSNPVGWYSANSIYLQISGWANEPLLIVLHDLQHMLQGIEINITLKKKEKRRRRGFCCSGDFIEIHTDRDLEWSMVAVGQSV